MTTYGLVYTLLLIAITLIILAIAFWGKGASKFTRLQDVYRDKYIDETETLDDDLGRGKIDQETYDATKVELAQDLLAVAHHDRQISPMTKAITLAFGVAVVAGSAVYFWGEGYTPDAQNLDTQRTAAMPYVQIWLESTAVEDLQRGGNLMDLNPPVQIQENLLGTLASLNLMSSRDHHTDPKELNLLGKIYLNMDQLDLAEKAYLDLYRLDPNNTNTYYTLLNIQLAKNEYKLDARLEALFDHANSIGPSGGTAMYEGIIYALDIIETEFQDKLDDYSPAIVVLTDGRANGDLGMRALEDKYAELGLDIPIFSITFGNASDDELEQIAQLTRARVFDGRENLIEAFQQVKGYN